MAENAFFCFLTDRTYFEQMRERTTDSPYPIEYTYFTNQIFVVFKHADLHEYLDRVLEPPASERSIEPAEQMEPDRDAAEYAIDREVLPYILLYGSQMHPIDLRRQLTAFRNARGEVSLEAGVVRSRPRYRLELMVQVAVQIVLDDEDMQAELDRDPAFLRLAIDALYYITRSWADAPRELDLSATGEHQFENYLRDRMGCEKSATVTTEDKGNSSTTQTLFGVFLQNAETQMNGGVATANQIGDERPRVAASTRRFLMERVRDLARLLAHPDLLRYKAERKRLRQSVIDALPTEALLAASDNNATAYRWLLYQSGRAVEATAESGAVPKAPASPQQWKSNYDYITQFAQNLCDFTAEAIDPGTLASQFGVIPTTPAWSAVKRASDRLRTASATELPYPEQEADVSILESFRILIKGSSETLALGLLCGEVLGHWSSRRLSGLKAIAHWFQLRELPANKVFSILKDLSCDLMRRFEIDEGLHNHFRISGDESARQISERVLRTRRTLTERLRWYPLAKFSETLWNIWYERFQDGIERVFLPSVEDLVCAATQIDAAKYLRRDVTSMNVGDWSKCVHGSLAQKDSSSPPEAPAWFAKLALSKLGFETPNRPDAPLRPFWSLSPEAEKLWDDLRIESGNKLPASALIVTMPGSRAILADCEPSKRGAALALRFEALTNLLKESRYDYFRDEIRSFFGFNMIVFEATGSTINPNEEGVRLVRKVFGADDNDYQQRNSKCRTIFCYPRGDAPGDGSDVQQIVGVKNLDDLFIEAERLTRESRHQQAASFGPVFSKFR